MSELNLNDMSQTYFDVLKEIGNIGAGNATTALAQLLNCKVEMKVPQVKLLAFAEVGDLIGGAEQIMAGIYSGLEGDIKGSIMFLLKRKSARNLVATLMGITFESEEFTEMEESALKEIGNIITGSYLNALSTLTNFKIYPTVPALCVDMAGAILSVPAIEFGAVGDRILLIQTQFSDELELDGYFIMVPDLESYDKILTSLGI